MYVKIDNNVVSEIIPDIDPTFPDVPIGERFTADFIAKLRHVPDGANVEVGMVYNPDTDSFGYPVPPDTSDLPDSPTEASEISQAEINLDFEFRLSCLELGIN